MININTMSVQNRKTFLRESDESTSSFESTATSASLLASKPGTKPFTSVFQVFADVDRHHEDIPSANGYLRSSFLLAMAKEADCTDDEEIAELLANIEEEEEKMVTKFSLNEVLAHLTLKHLPDLDATNPEDEYSEEGNDSEAGEGGSESGWDNPANDDASLQSIFEDVEKDESASDAEED